MSATAVPSINERTRPTCRVTARRIVIEVARIRARLEPVEPVADPPDGFDGIFERSQFLAQAEYHIVDRAVAAEQVVAPNRLQQIAAAEGAAGVAEEELQEIELGRGQVD